MKMSFSVAILLVSQISFGAAKSPVSENIVTTIFSVDESSYHIKVDDHGNFMAQVSHYDRGYYEPVSTDFKAGKVLDFKRFLQLAIELEVGATTLITRNAIMCLAIPHPLERSLLEIRTGDHQYRSYEVMIDDIGRCTHKATSLHRKVDKDKAEELKAILMLALS